MTSPSAGSWARPTSRSRVVRVLRWAFAWMRCPIAWFCVVLLVGATQRCFPDAWDASAWRRIGFLENAAFGFLAAWFVAIDTRKAKDFWPTDHMMVWSLPLFPYYLLTTRKWKGLAILVGLVVGLYLANLIPTFFT
jgi:hypothetical protein